jgi:EmrB/QacA subfamily drug resistance transporter
MPHGEPGRRVGYSVPWPNDGRSPMRRAYGTDGQRAVRIDPTPAGAPPPKAVPKAAVRERVAGPHPPTAGRAPHRWPVLAVIGIAQLMVVLDTTIVNIALPSAQADLGFGTDSRQWIITAYSLAFGSLLLLGGRLSDIVGRRRTLLIGLLGFAAASAAGGAATGFAMLVAARAAQGVFAAILAPAALSTLNVTFTDAKQRGKAFAVYSAIAASGAVAGLLLGGALTEWLSWRWCLYVNLGFAIPAAVGALVFVAGKDSRHDRARLDWLGVITASGGLFCLVYALSNAETHGWSDRLTIAMFVASAVLLGVFVVIEAHVSAPLLPLRVIRDRNRAGSYVAIAFAFCSLFGAFLFLTYYLQQNFGYSPMKTGVAFLPLAAGIAVAAGAANTRLVPRFGPRPLIPTGMLIGAGGMFWLTHLGVDSTYGADIAGPMVLVGLGMGLAFSPAIATATAGIAPADAGVASAMVNTSQQIGGAVGTAALSTIFASALSRYLTAHQPPTPDLPAAAAIHGYTVAFGVSCGLFLAGTLLTALLLRSGRLPETHIADRADAPTIAVRSSGVAAVGARTARRDLRTASSPKRSAAEHVPDADGAPQHRRAAELLGRGINHETVGLILDLEHRVAHLEADNRYLTERLYLADPGYRDR